VVSCDDDDDDDVCVIIVSQRADVEQQQRPIITRLLTGASVPVELVVHRGRIVHYLIRTASWRDAKGVLFRTTPAVLPHGVVLSTLDFDDTPLVDPTPQQRLQRCMFCIETGGLLVLRSSSVLCTQRSVD
jgi:hypothetical protein